MSWLFLLAALGVNLDWLTYAASALTTARLAMRRSLRRGAQFPTLAELAPFLGEQRTDRLTSPFPAVRGKRPKNRITVAARGKAK